MNEKSLGEFPIGSFVTLLTSPYSEDIWYIAKKVYSAVDLKEITKVEIYNLSMHMHFGYTPDCLAKEAKSVPIELKLRVITEVLF